MNMQLQMISGANWLASLGSRLAILEARGLDDSVFFSQHPHHSLLIIATTPSFLNVRPFFFFPDITEWVLLSSGIWGPGSHCFV